MTANAGISVRGLREKLSRPLTPNDGPKNGFAFFSPHFTKVPPFNRLEKFQLSKTELLGVH